MMNNQENQHKVRGTRRSGTDAKLHQSLQRPVFKLITAANREVLMAAAHLQSLGPMLNPDWDIAPKTQVELEANGNEYEYDYDYDESDLQNMVKTPSIAIRPPTPMRRRRKEEFDPRSSSAFTVKVTDIAEDITDHLAHNLRHALNFSGIEDVGNDHASKSARKPLTAGTTRASTAKLLPPRTDELEEKYRETLKTYSDMSCSGKNVSNEKKESQGGDEKPNSLKQNQFIPDFINLRERGIITSSSEETVDENEASLMTHSEYDSAEYEESLLIAASNEDNSFNVDDVDVIAAFSMSPPISLDDNGPVDHGYVCPPIQHFSKTQEEKLEGKLTFNADDKLTNILEDGNDDDDEELAKIFLNNRKANLAMIFDSDSSNSSTSNAAVLFDSDSSNSGGSSMDGRCASEDEKALVPRHNCHGHVHTSTDYATAYQDHNALVDLLVEEELSFELQSGESASDSDDSDDNVPSLTITATEASSTSVSSNDQDINVASIESPSDEDARRNYLELSALLEEELSDTVDLVSFDVSAIVSEASEDSSKECLKISMTDSDDDRQNAATKSEPVSVIDRLRQRRLEQIRRKNKEQDDNILDGDDDDGEVPINTKNSNETSASAVTAVTSNSTNLSSFDDRTTTRTCTSSMKSKRRLSTHSRLYNLSKQKQEQGKKRREDIALAIKQKKMIRKPEDFGVIPLSQADHMYKKGLWKNHHRELRLAVIRQREREEILARQKFKLAPGSFASLIYPNK